MKTVKLIMEGYKQWTESLGVDREWKIQAFQHYFSYLLYNKLAEIGSYVIPFRYDIHVILADGVREKDIVKVIEEIDTHSPTSIKLCKGYHQKPILSVFSCEEIDLDKVPDERILVAHYDIDGITKLNIQQSMEKIDFLMDYIKAVGKRLGCIDQYFGGDNLGLFCSEDTVEAHIKVVKELNDVKVGIGIGSKARDALRNATEALDEIRKFREEKWKIIG
ncbi:GTP cyclohydrolase IIa [Sulfolobus sp. SCGC AB-777_G06]|nr:GTP cyclohydrolase IIa [Sulfolobus sp. SCGC AB-777_G06]